MAGGNEVMNARKKGRLACGRKVRCGCVHLAPGENVGEHSTGNGEEVILVLEGEARVMANGESHRLCKDECILIGEGISHDVFNCAAGKNLVYIYFIGGKEMEETEYARRKH